MYSVDLTQAHPTIFYIYTSSIVLSANGINSTSEWLLIAHGEATAPVYANHQF